MYIGALSFLVAVEFVLTMLLYPLRIGAFGHVSLAHDKLDINVTMIGITVARIRVKREDGIFKLYVNGKRVKPNKGKISAKQITDVVRKYRLEGMKLRGNLLALVGTGDAMTTALLCAGLNGVLKPILSSVGIYTATPSDTLEIDGRLKTKMTFIQAIGLIVAGLKAKAEQ